MMIVMEVGIDDTGHLMASWVDLDGTDPPQRMSANGAVDALAAEIAHRLAYLAEMTVPMDITGWGMALAQMLAKHGVRVICMRPVEVLGGR